MTQDRVTEQVPTFKPAQQVFEQAIADGRLSADPHSTAYAGRYMYMGTWNGKDAFKHTQTREYLAEPP
jgi:hypothetical protein